MKVEILTVVVCLVGFLTLPVEPEGLGSILAVTATSENMQRTLPKLLVLTVYLIT